jgi:hypothetical protein
MSGSCPYSALINKIPFINTKNNTGTSENQNSNINLEASINTIEQNLPKEIEIVECPHKNKNNQSNNREYEKDNLIKIKNDDSDEDIPRGGCPIMNGSKNKKIF